MGINWRNVVAFAISLVPFAIGIWILNPDTVVAIIIGCFYGLIMSSIFPWADYSNYGS